MRISCFYLKILNKNICSFRLTSGQLIFLDYSNLSPHLILIITTHVVRLFRGKL